MRLDDIKAISFSLSKRLKIPWKHPSLGIKLIQLRHKGLGLVKIHSQQILPSQLATTRKMVDPLITLDPFDEFLSDIGIDPYEEDITLLILLIVKLVIEVLMDEVVDH